jgi:hypothetical protein
MVAGYSWIVGSAEVTREPFGAYSRSRNGLGGHQEIKGDLLEANFGLNSAALRA